MVSKYDVFSYFLSILVNFLFLLTFFSTLNFKIHKEEVVKVKLISQPEVTLPPFLSSGSSSFESITKSSAIFTRKSIEKINADKKREEIKEERSFSEEGILREKIAKIESKISEKGVESNYYLSDEEKGVLEKKLLAFQKKKTAGSVQGENFSGSSLNREYLLLIKRKLQNNFEIPIYLRAQKDLYAVLSIKLSSEGKILNYRFLKESKNSEFNKAIEKCLKASSPLPVNKEISLIIEFRGEGIGKIK